MKNCIGKLISDQRVECNTLGQIEAEITESYHRLFSTSNPTKWEEVLEGLSSSITSLMNQRLARPVEDSEIKKALFVMHPNKSPGPDEMTPLFFQKC